MIIKYAAHSRAISYMSELNAVRHFIIGSVYLELGFLRREAPKFFVLKINWYESRPLFEMTPVIITSATRRARHVISGR